MRVCQQMKKLNGGYTVLRSWLPRQKHVDLYIIDSENVTGNIPRTPSENSLICSQWPLVTHHFWSRVLLLTKYACTVSALTVDSTPSLNLFTNDPVRFYKFLRYCFIHILGKGRGRAKHLVQNQFTFKQYADGFMHCNLLPTGHKITLACQLSVAQISGPATVRSVPETHVSLSQLYSQRPVRRFVPAGFFPWLLCKKLNKNRRSRLDMEYDLYCVLRSTQDLTKWALKRVSLCLLSR
jgi:hypothetical protein